MCGGCGGLGGGGGGGRVGGLGELGGGRVVGTYVEGQEVGKGEGEGGNITYSGNQKPDARWEVINQPQPDRVFLTRRTCFIGDPTGLDSHDRVRSRMTMVATSIIPM